MRRRFLAPEVLQISTMDCGVAALSCMLAGHGIPVSYEKLREACQTSVDGTSIDVLEEIAVDLGLDVMQHIMPRDLLWDVAEGRLPGIAIAQRHEAGLLHFVTVWSAHGRRLQVMDPGGGRRWPTRASFESELYVHALRQDRATWSQWMSTSTFRDALQGRACKHLSARAVEQRVLPVLENPDPLEVATLDAALRLVARAVDADGPKSIGWREELFARAWQAGLTQRLPTSLLQITTDGVNVTTRGVVLLASVEAKHENRTPTAVIESRAAELGFGAEPSKAIWGEVWGLLGKDGRRLGVGVIVGTLGLALATAVELLLYRAALDAPRLFTTPRLRLGAALAVGVLLIAIAGLEALLTRGSSRLARRLELAVRARTLFLLPRVPDEFIQSRPSSDLAYRAHGLAQAGASVSSVQSAVGAAGDLLVTLFAIGVLDVRFSFLAAGGAVLFALIARAFRPRLQEIDSRLQISASRLLGILLDSLRGCRPVRLHGFQSSLRNVQSEEIERWRSNAEAQFDTVAALQAMFSFNSTILIASLFAVSLLRHGDPRSFVLLALWSFRLPSAVQRLVHFAQSYPQQKNSLTRTLEITRQKPLEAPVDPEPSKSATGISLSLRGVQILAGGHPVLRGIDLDIPAGQHVAIVGPSGSGKSSLVGVLLGFHRIAEGELRIDGEPMDARGLRRLRPSIGWMDPSVQLWNASVSDNLEYASVGRPQRARLSVLEESDLLGVLGGLDQGLDTQVGSEGAFLSGGEGQRLRLARALLPAGTRLAILDEAFRGLERRVRERLANQVRIILARSTLLFVSHDVKQALSFERVLVVDEGRIAEDGVPAELAGQDSRFARMLRMEQELLEGAWGRGKWRTVQVADGNVREVDHAG
jgi:ABC-type multidrug transport system fused ATPase/permease subunit